MAITSNDPKVSKEEPTLLSRLNLNELKAASKIIRAVNHPLRQEIIDIIERSEGKKLNVTQIYFKKRIEQSVASQHLAILREAKVLLSERKGKNIYYFLNREKLESILDAVQSLQDRDTGALQLNRS